MIKERRKFPRANIRYRISVICEGEIILGEPADFVFHTFTENIGMGGLKVTLEKQLKIASLVNLELFLSNKAQLPIACKGIITWSRKVNPSGTKPDLFDTGIQFINLGEIEEQIIYNLVTRFLNTPDKAKK